MVDLGCRFQFSGSRRSLVECLGGQAKMLESLGDSRVPYFLRVVRRASR